MWRSQLLPLLIMPPLLVMATTCDVSCSSKETGPGSSAMGGGTCVTCGSSDQNVSVWSLVWMSRCLDPLRFGEARYSSLSFPGCRAPRALGAPRWVLGVVTEKALSLAPGTWEAFWLGKLNMNNINEECVSAKLSVYVLSGIYYLKNKQEWEDCLINRELKPLGLSPFSRTSIKWIHALWRASVKLSSCGSTFSPGNNL